MCGLISTSLFAWGVVGHRVIAHIADAHLTEDTRFWLKKILMLIVWFGLQIGQMISKLILSDPSLYGTMVILRI